MELERAARRRCRRGLSGWEVAEVTERVSGWKVTGVVEQVPG